MGKIKSETKLSAKNLSTPLKSSVKVSQPKAQEKEKFTRLRKEIKTELSPKFTEKKTGERTSRFGRPQKAAQQEINSIPTDVSKFISNYSPKRLKTKVDLDLSLKEEKMENKSLEVEIASKIEDIPSHNKEHLDDAATKVAAEGNASFNETMEQEKSVDTLVTSLNMTLEEIMDEGLKADPSKDVNDQSKQSDENEDLNEEDNHEATENHSDSVSDTDSALGSAASCIDHKDEEVSLGQVLWGSFNRQSWWPCIVYPVDETGTFISDHGKMKKIHVKYFNWNNKNNSALLHTRNIFEFKSLEKFWEQTADRGIKKSKIKPFSKACHKAIEEATFFSQQPDSKRLELYDEYAKKLKTSRRSTDAGKVHSKSRSVAERKSIDSALESPAPSSPLNDNILDPLEFLFKSMSKYDEMPEKKPPKVVTPKSVKIEPAESQDDNVQRRRSGRAVKKRTYEDFTQELEVDIKPAVELPAVEQKPKKPKLEKEETLEERFVVKQQDMRAFLRNIGKKRVCVECLENTEEPTFRCSGKDSIKCSGWFHKDCSAEHSIVSEKIRHQTGDSDEIIEIPTMKSTLICKACFSGELKCFICKFPLGQEGHADGICPYPDCRMLFHQSCLMHWPQAKNSNANRKSIQCPQHTCHTCFSKEIHNTGQLIKCVKCPSAYHVQPSCVPAGTQILSQSQIICPRHPTEKELVRNKKETKPLNIDWCQLCPDVGSLVCCELCPAAFHPKCINYVDSDDVFICQECKDGRLPLYNTIVWARVGTYRWWPGLIMPNNVIPETIVNTRKFTREFCVRFFGSYDFYWFPCERVFPYDGTNISVKGGSSRLDHAFNIALNEAHQMSKILDTDAPQIMNAKPKPYVKIIQNRPVAPVKLKKVGEFTQEQCGCKPKDADPCGRSSDCINLHLNVECSKGVCPAGDRCQNQKLRNREYAGIKVIKTSHRGFGAVCTHDVPEDSFVIEYVGELIDTSEFTRRMNLKIQNKEKDFYFLTVEGDLYVDAGPAGNLSRFINHSCEPNCITRKIQVDGNTRIGIFANQFIESGTELTFDYQMEFVDNKKTACFCGARKCSGLIGEKPKDEKPEKKVIVKAKRVRRRQALVKAETKKLPAVVEVSIPPVEPQVEETVPDVTMEQEIEEDVPPAAKDLTPKRASPEKIREVDETSDPMLTTLEKMALGDFVHSQDENSRGLLSSAIEEVAEDVMATAVEVVATKLMAKMEVDEIEPSLINLDAAVADASFVVPIEESNEKPSVEAEKLEPVIAEPEITPEEEQTSIVDTPPMSPTTAVTSQ